MNAFSCFLVRLLGHFLFLNATFGMAQSYSPGNVSKSLSGQGFQKAASEQIDPKGAGAFQRLTGTSKYKST